MCDFLSLLLLDKLFLVFCLEFFSFLKKTTDERLLKSKIMNSQSKNNKRWILLSNHSLAKYPQQCKQYSNDELMILIAKFFVFLIEKYEHLKRKEISLKSTAIFAFFILAIFYWLVLILFYRLFILNLRCNRIKKLLKPFWLFCTCCLKNSSIFFCILLSLCNWNSLI